MKRDLPSPTRRLFGRLTGSAAAGVVVGALGWYLFGSVALALLLGGIVSALTFFAGAVMAWLFARERNIIPLAIGQGILGTLVWWAFPVTWHHAMRVGPGFYRFHPR